MVRWRNGEVILAMVKDRLRWLGLGLRMKNGRLGFSTIYQVPNKKQVVPKRVR